MTTLPASFSWNTTNSANGSHTLQAMAYDAAGNVGTSASVTETVQNTVASPTPPTVAITSPGNGNTINSKNTKVYVSITDTVGVTKADLLVDGKRYSTLSNTSATTAWNPVFSWSTGKLSRGSHTLQSVGYDTANNTARSTVITVYK